MPDGLGFAPVQGTEILLITHDRFPDGFMSYCIPESIGDVNRGIWTAAPRTRVKPAWSEAESGGQYYSWEREGLLRYSVLARRDPHSIDVHMSLRNLSDHQWQDTYSFSCFNTCNFPEFTDFDGSRTYLKTDGIYVPITQVERKDSPRPTIQLWYINGGARPLGFVEGFQASPDVYPEGVLLIRSWDRKHLVAVASDRPLFLFANLEFSCIHCCPSFGALKPGEEGRALHRAYVLPDTNLAEFDTLLKRELPNYAR